MSMAGQQVIKYTFFMYGKSLAGTVAMDTIVAENEDIAARMFMDSNPDMFYACNYFNMVDLFMP